VNRKYLAPRKSEPAHNPAIWRLHDLAEVGNARYHQPVQPGNRSTYGKVTSLRPGADIVQSVETPAFVLDERRLLRDLKAAARLRDECDFKLLYTLKPLCCEFVLELLARRVDGFACSSLFEARLAREVIDPRGTVHLTSPGLRDGELGELSELCDYITFNSISQLRRLGADLDGPEQVGVRVNPQFSLVSDERYDPCRRYSKLGIPLDRLARRWGRDPKLFQGVRGLQFHTNCDCSSFEPLYRTVQHVEESLRGLLGGLAWINLGGGYLLNSAKRTDLLAQAIERLRSRYGLVVFIEPGAALVRRAGYLVASVIDLFRAGGKSIAVLDTTVNHLPEVFEYQFEPDVAGHNDDGEFEYRLAGSSCLAGDLFGEYAFSKRLRIGSRVMFPDVGAYAMVKAHMFNGINLPAIYSVTRAGELVLRRRFTFEDFLSRFGACRDAAV
jgi:carboxynorspermidine decarboxylase